MDTRPTRFFICHVDHSANMEKGWVYVHIPDYGSETEHAISTMPCQDYERIGPMWQGLKLKSEMLEITKEDFEKFQQIWYDWGKGKCDENEVSNLVDQLILKYMEKAE